MENKVEQPKTEKPVEAKPEVKTEKPVVLTGAMRPATAISADGPMNLYQSVVVAASKEAIGKGVLGVFSDSIYSARSMQKESSFDVTAISAGPMGALGFVRNKEVFFYEVSTKYHTEKSDFKIFVYFPRVKRTFLSYWLTTLIPVIQKKRTIPINTRMVYFVM